MQCDQYTLSCNRKPANFAWNLALFQSHWMNISWIANAKVGGKRAAKSAQSTYWLCYDTIRTWILNWCQSCRNHKVGTAVQIQPGQKPTILYAVWVTTPQGKVSRVFGSDWNSAEKIFRSKPRLLAGYTYTLLTLLIVEWLLKLMYSVCILICVSI